MNSMTPRYSTQLFVDVYSDADTFLNDYKNIGIQTTITEASARTLYYLIYAQYGNTPIANLDVNQFKYKFFSIVFQYGPVWEKKLEIQNKLIALSEEELLQGSKAVYNHANNPSTAPTQASLEELTYIDDQNTTNYKKSKLEAYSILLETLNDRVTENFIKKFKNLFKMFVRNEHPLLYEEEDQ